MALIVGGQTVTGTQTLDATKLSGNLPAISGASLTGISASSFTRNEETVNGDTNKFITAPNPVVAFGYCNTVPRRWEFAANGGQINLRNATTSNATAYWITIDG